MENKREGHGCLIALGVLMAVLFFMVVAGVSSSVWFWYHPPRYAYSGSKLMILDDAMVLADKYDATVTEMDDGSYKVDYYFTSKHDTMYGMTGGPDRDVIWLCVIFGILCPGTVVVALMCGPSI